MIQNRNELYGDAIEFDTVEDMAQAIMESGYELPGDGLIEGRDYEVLE